MSELIPYTTATAMAGTYQSSVARLRQLIVEVGVECDKLKAAFGDGYHFDVDMHFDGSNHDANLETANKIEGSMRRAAWGALIAKLGIRKLMSSKRAGELDDAIYDRRRSYGDDKPHELPAIDEETIYQVLSGMVESAEEFMAEAVAEEYDYFKPSKAYAAYVRNSEFTLAPKIIRPWMVERGWGKSQWRPRHDSAKHLIALDNIFHRLDGAGIPDGYSGPLVDAIQSCDAGGHGETVYFRFRCCKNGNIHLEFKRLDLLEQFNAIAGRNRLPNTPTSRDAEDCGAGRELMTCP